MGNIKNTKEGKKLGKNEDVGSVVKYTNAPFFKKKDEEANCYPASCIPYCPS